MENRNFKGVWIPKEIWNDERLSANDKVLLTEIDSLDNSTQHCFAGNDYFAKFIHVSESTISRSIKKLHDIGYITNLGVIDGRTRVIICNVHYSVEQGSVVKMTKQINQYDKSEMSKRPHNNINNNTSNKYVVVDEERFLKAIEKEQTRILEAYRTDEYSNKAIQYAIDSFNCFGPDQIAVINKFSDSDYNQLFKIAFSLVSDDVETKNIDNKKAFFSNEIKKHIKNVKKMEEK